MLNSRSVFAVAPLGVDLLRLIMQRELRLKVASGMCVGAAEDKIGSMTLKSIVENSKFPEMKEVKS